MTQAQAKTQKKKAASSSTDSSKPQKTQSMKTFFAGKAKEVEVSVEDSRASVEEEASDGQVRKEIFKKQKSQSRGSLSGVEQQAGDGQGSKEKPLKESFKKQKTQSRDGLAGVEQEPSDSPGSKELSKKQTVQSKGSPSGVEEEPSVGHAGKESSKKQKIQSGGSLSGKPKPAESKKKASNEVAEHGQKACDESEDVSPKSTEKRSAAEGAAKSKSSSKLKACESKKKASDEGAEHRQKACDESEALQGGSPKSAERRSIAEGAAKSKASSKPKAAESKKKASDEGAEHGKKACDEDVSPKSIEKSRAAAKSKSSSKPKSAAESKKQASGECAEHGQKACDESQEASSENTEKSHGAEGVPKSKASSKKKAGVLRTCSKMKASACSALRFFKARGDKPLQTVEQDEGEHAAATGSPPVLEGASATEEPKTDSDGTPRKASQRESDPVEASPRKPAAAPLKRRRLRSKGPVEDTKPPPGSKAEGDKTQRLLSETFVKSLIPKPVAEAEETPERTAQAETASKPGEQKCEAMQPEGEEQIPVVKATPPAKKRKSVKPVHPDAEGTGQSDKSMKRGLVGIWGLKFKAKKQAKTDKTSEIADIEACTTEVSEAPAAPILITESAEPEKKSFDWQAAFAKATAPLPVDSTQADEPVVVSSEAPSARGASAVAAPLRKWLKGPKLAAKGSKPQPVAPKVSSFCANWSDRNAPTNQKQLPKDWLRLRDWLKAWKPDSNSSKGRKALPRAALVVGPPGAGKTAGVRFLAQRVCGHVVEYDLIDAEGRSFMENLAKRQRNGNQLPGNTVVVCNIAEQISQIQKDTLLQAAKSSPSPVILVAAEGIITAKDNLWSICEVLRVGLRESQVVRILQEIAKKEAVSLPQSTCELIAAACPGDLRHAIATAQLLSVAGGENQQLPQAAMAPKAACSKLLSCEVPAESRRLGVDEALDLLALDEAVPSLLRWNAMRALAVRWETSSKASGQAGDVQCNSKESSSGTGEAAAVQTAGADEDVEMAEGQVEESKEDDEQVRDGAQEDMDVSQGQGEGGHDDGEPANDGVQADGEMADGQVEAMRDAEEETKEISDKLQGVDEMQSLEAAPDPEELLALQNCSRVAELIALSDVAAGLCDEARDRAGTMTMVDVSHGPAAVEPLLLTLLSREVREAAMVGEAAKAMAPQHPLETVCPVPLEQIVNISKQLGVPKVWAMEQVIMWLQQTRNNVSRRTPGLFKCWLKRQVQTLFSARQASLPQVSEMGGEVQATDMGGLDEDEMDEKSPSAVEELQEDAEATDVNAPGPLAPPAAEESGDQAPPPAPTEPALEESAPPPAPTEPALEESAPPPAPTEPALEESAPPPAPTEPALEESAPPPAPTEPALEVSAPQAPLAAPAEHALEAEPEDRSEVQVAANPEGGV